MLGVSTELGVALWANAEDVFERLDEPIMLTSPPYPLATPRAYGNVPLARYVEWIVDMLEPLAKRLRQGGTMAMNISNDISNQEVQHDQRFGSDWSSLCVMSWRCSSGTDEFIWHNPSKAPGPIQWASRTQQQLNVAWEPVYIFTNDPHRCVASNRRVLQTHTAKQIELIRTGAVAQEGASVMVPIAAKKAHSGGLRRGEFRETSNPLRMVADVISCSGGFLSACWFDVIARMVAVTVPNAAFERLLAARSGLLFPEPERLLKAGCGHSFLVTELLHDLGSGHSPVSSASDCLCI